jgi:acyl-CoA synthetase (AMP-forming)/AMP-acid ligase II
MTLSNYKLIPDISNIVELLRYRAASTPDKTAFAFLSDGETIGTSLTFQELDQRAQAIAVKLLTHSRPGDRVLLAYPPGLEFVPAFFGCLYAGIVAVPVQPPVRNQVNEKWLEIAFSSGCKLVLTTSEFYKKPIKNMICSLENEASKIRWLSTDDTGFDTQVQLDESTISGDSLAFLQYTSGSTTNPKGVMITHHNLLQNAAIIQEGFQLDSDSNAFSWLPVYHDMGLMGGIIQPIYLGLTMTLMSPLLFLQKPLRWLRAISRYRSVISGAPNFAYDLCVQKIKPEQLSDLDLSCWELAPIGAEPVRAETIENFSRTFGASGFSPSAFYPCFGLAEATLFVAGGEKATAPVRLQVNKDALEQHQVILEEDMGKAQVLVGHGHGKLGQKIIIVDLQSRRECSVGQVGEIWTSGLNISSGYWQLPQEAEETFQAFLTNGEGPFLRTGDLGFVFKGDLFITGRLKEMMIIRGRNHYPQEIERTVQKCHPALRSDAGAAFAIEVGGVEQLVVVQEVERRHMRNLDGNLIIRQVRRAINEQHGLHATEIMLVRPGSILKTSSGKVQRHACKDAFIAGRFQTAA